MMLIGLAGAAGAGKDTVADYLVEQYGFVKFSFSDALYKEVAAAFGVAEEVLRDRALKDQPHADLCAQFCAEPEFAAIMIHAARENGEPQPLATRFSPRWVLQHWGTEYRRAQDPEYWTKKAALYVKAFLQVTAEDGEYHAGLVNTSVRFPNEQKLIHDLGGAVWHVHRWADKDEAAASGVASELDHVSEAGLPLLDGDRELFNSGTVEQLHTAISLLLQAPFEADPLSVIELPDEEQDFPLVACTKCGKMYHGLTESQAQAEVDAFNHYLDSLSDEHRAAFSHGEAMLDMYRGCTGCGGDTFVPFEVRDREALRVVSVSPVIYEKENTNG